MICGLEKNKEVEAVVLLGKRNGGYPLHNESGSSNMLV